MAAHLLRVTSAEAALPRFLSLKCGGCGRRFDANTSTVPVFRGHPCCRVCWDRRAVLRARAGLPAQARPRCYPEDYQVTC